MKKLGLKSVLKVRGRRMSRKTKEDRLSFFEYALRRMARERDPFLIRAMWFSFPGRRERGMTESSNPAT